MSLTEMTTLACILSELFPLDYLSCNAILNTVMIIFMKLYSSVEEMVTMCHIYKIWQLTCSYFS